MLYSFLVRKAYKLQLLHKQFKDYQFIFIMNIVVNIYRLYFYTITITQNIQLSLTISPVIHNTPLLLLLLQLLLLSLLLLLLLLLSLLLIIHYHYPLIIVFN